VRPILATILAAGVLAAPIAQAQTAADDAKARYKEGLVHYNVKEYAEAVALFKQAYKLNPDPAYLYNIAQAYRLAGDCDNAASYYRTFLRDAPAGTANLDKAQRFLAEMETCIAERKSPEPATTTTTSEPPPVAPTEATPPSETAPAPETVGVSTTTSPGGGGSPRLRIAGIATASAGVAVTVAGVVFGLRARGAHDDLVDRLAANDGIWDDALEAREQDAQRDETLGVGLVIGGAATVIAGGVLWYLGRDRGEAGESTRSLTLTPTRGGATVGWACDF